MRLIENGGSSQPPNEAAVGPKPQLQAVPSIERSLSWNHPGRLVGLADANDRAVRDYAKANGFTLISLDSDFADMAALLGSPPKVIWLRCGNQPTAMIESLLRSHAAALAEFELDAATACLEIY
jgi:predicted nuclease of predicted toxin-antitoxin system